jgi:hypothetical protein
LDDRRLPRRPGQPHVDHAHLDDYGASKQAADLLGIVLNGRPATPSRKKTAPAKQ